jgi:hypothetical protein
LCLFSKITLEEQSIHGGLQILNEEASEDVTENAIEEDLSAATGELVNSGKVNDFIKNLKNPSIV